MIGHFWLVRCSGQNDASMQSRRIVQLHFGQRLPDQRRRPRPEIAMKSQEMPAVSQDINVLALVKGAERYVFLYDDASRAETLRTLGRYASNPELSFTWYDAAVLSQKIRQESQKFQPSSRFGIPMPADPEEY